MPPAVVPPVAPMLARLARELPDDADVVFEPKWDGFRCLAFVDDGGVDLRSRQDRPLARYFPEVVGALRALGGACVLDGELIVERDGSADFPALMARLHPSASRVDRLARETPAAYVAFDVLAVGADDLRSHPFARRRATLERLLREPPAGVCLTPATTDRAEAAAWLRARPGGAIDGVMVKPATLRYSPGVRAMTKVKAEHTVDCVVAGARLRADRPEVSSLLLGVYDDRGALRHLGAAQSFDAATRRSLAELLGPLVVGLEGHPWELGFGLEGGHTGRLRGAGSRWTPALERDWVPLRPELVCEVGYDRVDGVRFRHPARFVRWRPDRDAESCRLEQLLELGAVDPTETGMAT